MTTASAFPESRGAVRYLQAFRAHWLLILALALLAVGTAAVVAFTATKKYEASADLQIQALPAFGGDQFQGFDVFRQTADGASPTVTAARVLGSRVYQDALRHRLGPRAGGVTVTLNPLSQADIVTVHATAHTAALAATAANTYTTIIVEQRKALFQRELRQKMQQISVQIAAIPVPTRATSPTYSSLAGALGSLRAWVNAADPTVQVLTPANVPIAPSWPRPKLTLIVALAIGLLLGAATAVTLELVNPRVSREDELALSQGLPTLARLPRINSADAHDYLLGHALLPPEMWKGYRTLRAVLANAGIDGGYPRSILVTSASPGDGKTMTAVNLAIALAAAELRVTLVDADFHRPMVGTIFNVTNRHDGLVRLLSNPDAARTGTVAAPTYARLKLLLSSRQQMHQLHLFDTQRIEKLLARLEQESDVIVFDSPPVPEVAEAIALASAVETVIVCVRMRHTRRDKLNDLRDLLARRGVTPLGFLVTTRERPQSSPSEYEYATDVTATPTRSTSAARKQIERYSRK
ncbi:MAG: tyrosine-protein kinase [Gaiellaceae bacterium]|nr:tyrosine-protein kinase [Gaiellaceae bacterium]